MTTPVIPNDGSKAFMDVLVYSIQGGRLNSKIHLFQNDVTPDSTFTLASFVECIAGGMGNQPLSVPTDQGFDPSGRDIWYFPETIFTATGSNLPAVIYGYWVDFTDPITATTRVLWCRRFTTPQAILSAGNTIKFMLSFGGKQC